jgi:hypothetical protein
MDIKTRYIQLNQGYMHGKLFDINKLAANCMADSTKRKIKEKLDINQVSRIFAL